jgi:hypothetical protein
LKSYRTLGIATKHSEHNRSVWKCECWEISSRFWRITKDWWKSKMLGENSKNSDAEFSRIKERGPQNANIYLLQDTCNFPKHKLQTDAKLFKEVNLQRQKFSAKTCLEYFCTHEKTSILSFVETPAGDSQWVTQRAFPCEERNKYNYKASQAENHSVKY